MLPKILTPIPGPRSRLLAQQLRSYESRNITYLTEDFPVFWRRAEGVNVWDADDNRFLDLTSAFGVSSLGHNPPHVRAALGEQAAQMIHAMGDVHPAIGKAELCVRLSALTFERWGAGRGKVILGNSGSDAIEAALKTALLHTGKAGVIAFTGGYHGLGLGALSTSGIPFFREPFRAQLKDFGTFLSYPADAEADLAELRRSLEKRLRESPIGCILAEPIQARGGCVEPPPAFLPMLREVAHAANVLLVLDEVFTGFNRTGSLFACERHAVVPDLICLGKALTGGFPLSACVGRAAVMDAWPPSSGEALHTSTFLGNPLGCAMALANLQEHARPEIATRVNDQGDRLKSVLENLPSPRARRVRGRGLMLGMELTKPNGAPDAGLAVAIVKRALQDGLLLLADSPTNNVLMFTPPFSIDDEEVAFVASRLQEYFTLLPGSIS